MSAGDEQVVARSTVGNRPPRGGRLIGINDELFPAEQARIVALLVERVDIGTGGLNVRLRMDGLGSLAREMRAGNMGTAA